MTDSLYIEWGQHLRQRRTAAGLTQMQLAEKANSSNAQISNIERGTSAPSDALRMRLAAALSITPAELFPYPNAVSA